MSSVSVEQSHIPLLPAVLSASEQIRHEVSAKKLKRVRKAIDGNNGQPDLSMVSQPSVESADERSPASDNGKNDPASVLLRYKPTTAVNLLLHLFDVEVTNAIKQREVEFAKIREEQKKDAEAAAEKQPPTKQQIKNKAAPAKKEKEPAEQTKTKPQQPKAKAVSTGYNFKDNPEDALRRSKFVQAMREVDAKINAQIDASLVRLLDIFIEILQDKSFQQEADADTYTFLKMSSLNGFLGGFLRGLTIEDLSLRLSLLKTVCILMKELGSNPNTLATLAPAALKRFGLTGNVTDVVEPLKGLVGQAKLYVLADEKNDDGAERDELTTSAMKVLKVEGDQAVKAIEQMCGFVSAALKQRSDEAKYDDSDEKKTEAEKEHEVQKIRTWMRSKQFEICDLSAEPFKFEKEVGESAKVAPNKKRLVRIGKEMAILSNSLPDGIFVRVNEDRMDIIKVLIIGPSDTPYQNGCFVFDLYLPPEFPSKPPKMRMRTTGTGYRFNPNLYVDGYVCLSLLGTWQGPGWEPETSTLLQLLVSLQAMVFCEEPYTNEPGWYGSKGSQQSKEYNKQLRQATALFAMLWHLTQPEAPFFKSIIDAHLYLLRDELPQQLERWEKANAEIAGDNRCYSSELNLPKQWSDIKSDLLKHLKEVPAPKIE